jgi:hypothetical protein
MSLKVELIRFTYETLNSKQQIVNDFSEKYPQCSKSKLEQVFKEMFVKETRNNDKRPCYYAHASVLEEL